jgi:bacteriorhodopsin
MPWPSILLIILLDEVMIVCGLVGALVQSRYKWAYFAFGCAAFIYVVYKLVITGRRRAFGLGNDVHRVYTSCGVLTLFVWFLYPIAWGVSEGGNVIAPDSEAIFYGVLDIISKPVFGALLLFGHRGIDPARLGLTLRDVDTTPTGVPGEKRAPRARNGVSAA